MTKHRRSAFKRSRNAKWNTRPTKINRHMLARKGIRNAAPGGL